MKIAGGRFKGRTLETPRGRNVRPTGARTREAVFDILVNGKPAVEFEGRAVIDAFAGTGALGFEALSRGAATAVFIERAAGQLALIKRNADKLGLARDCLALRLDAATLGPPPRAASAAGIAFLDPPYGEGLARPALLGLARHGWLTPNAVIVVETEAKFDLPPPPHYSVIDERVYGAARVHFLRYQPAMP